MSKKIQRRKFLAGAVCAGAALGSGVAFSAPAVLRGHRKWKMVLTWQKVLPGLGKGAMRLARRIAALSEGKLDITVYGGGEFVPAMQVFDAVASGTAEMGHCAPYYWLNKSKAMAFFCSVPGGLTMQEQNGWLYFGGGKELWKKLYAEFGLVPFPAGNTGCQMGGWFNKELHSLESLSGLKMRIPGLAGEVFSKLGGSAQVIPPQELFTAMQSGVIDALEWVGPWNDIALGFHKVSRYYYGPAFQEGGPTLELIVNKNAYDALPNDLQRIIKVACAAENALMAAEYHANNIRAFAELTRKHQVDVRVYPPDILRSFFQVAEEVVADVAHEGKMARDIYQSYMRYRQYAMEMSPYTELGFMQGRL